MSNASLASNLYIIEDVSLSPIVSWTSNPHLKMQQSTVDEEAQV